MGLKHWFNAQSDTMKVAIIGGLTTVTGGIVTGGFTFVNTALDKPSSSSGPTTGDQAKRYIITLVLASPSCARYLRTARFA
jgi:Flp pilus assembly pilin Flp